MKPNKIYQPEQIAVKRSEINFADYNPRYMTDDVRKALKANLTKIGLLGGIVWNRRTGNLVSGHQRVSIMDSVNRYNPETGDNDYEFRVEAVDLDIVTEKEQNLFMNNRKVQGEYDEDMLRKMLKDIDYKQAGFDDFDMEMLGLGGVEDFNPTIDGGFDAPAPQGGNIAPPREWSKEDVIGDSAEMAAHDEITKEGGENHKIDRSTNFYEDTEANQLARHNEIQKIKDRIASNSDINRDGGLLSYVVISFKSPSEKANFMTDYGFPIEAKYIDGEEFVKSLEFGE